MIFFNTLIILFITVLPNADLTHVPDGCYVAKEGSTVRINIPVSGMPAPVAIWKKGGITLSDSGRMSVESAPGISTLLIRDIQRGDADKFGLVVRNSGGTKEAVIDLKVVGKPGLPTGPIVFDEITADAITLEWGPPKDDGGSEVSNYIVEKRHTTASKWVTVASALQKTSMRVMRLHDGTEYIFRVFAENKYGVGDWLRSDPIIAKHPFGEFNHFDSVMIVNRIKTVHQLFVLLCFVKP